MRIMIMRYEGMKVWQAEELREKIVELGDDVDKIEEIIKEFFKERGIILSSGSVYNWYTDREELEIGIDDVVVVR